MSPAPDKIKLIDDLTDDLGVAIVIVDPQSRELDKSNNNSICKTLYPSAEFGPRCLEFCGKAYVRAVEAGGIAEYRCHAGLECRAVAINEDESKGRAAIVGRAFIRTADYRDATERATSGDWVQFDRDEFFGNVLISTPQDLDQAARRIAQLSDEQKRSILENEQATDAGAAGAVPPVPTVEASGTGISELQHPAISEWRSAFGTLSKQGYAQACMSVLDFLAERYNVPESCWLERKDDRFDVAAVRGELKDKSVRIAVSPEDARLVAAASTGEPLVLRERGAASAAKRSISLFPVIISGDVRSALAVAGHPDQELSHRVARFCRMVGPQLEILRLREDVSRREAISSAMRKFNEGLRNIDSDDFWMQMMQISAELLQAERASLLVPVEKTDRLQTVAAIGAREDLSFDLNIGSRIAREILDKGKPVVVSDVYRLGIGAAPPERRYRTDSFLSYPIIIGSRRLGVLNFTDKAGDNVFAESDVELLRSIVPQIAVAIDRSELKGKAGEFAQLSVTDSLTGLLNRRYIEERLTEEIIRSNRHSYPMSFMMVDVDEFKSYNDQYGHLAGDEALKIVGRELKDSLRGADVAARFGGEEFSILLPQTTGEEAHIIAERIRERIAQAEFPYRRITISIGVASRSPSVNNVRDLIGAADKALYAAKAKGRNNVQFFGEPRHGHTAEKE